MAWVTAISGADVLLPLAKALSAVYIANILHAVLVYSGSVYFFAKMNPLHFFRGMFEALAVAFTTCSSAATLPVSMRNAQKNLGVPNEISSFVQPLGATINMGWHSYLHGGIGIFYRPGLWDSPGTPAIFNDYLNCHPGSVWGGLVSLVPRLMLGHGFYKPAGLAPGRHLAHCRCG